MSRRGWTAAVVFVGLANFLTGRLALLLAVPPEQVASIWLPAGISLAAVLLFGRSVWPGVFLGSGLAHLATLLGAPAASDGARLAVVAAALAAGSTIQALTTAWVLSRRGVDAERLDEGWHVFEFFVYGCLAGGLIASTLGVSALWLDGRIPAGLLLRTWSTWWIAEALGAVLAGPIVIGFLSPCEAAWKGRRLAVFGPLGATLVVALAIFWMAHSAQTSSIAIRFQSRAGSLADRLESTWRNYEAVVSSMATFVEAADGVDRGRFEQVARRLLSENLGVVALQWAPRVESGEREAFESAMREQEAVTGFEVRDLAPDGRLVRAAPRAVYHPVAYVEPWRGFERSLGLDLASEPVRDHALEHARSSGKTVASAPVRPLGPSEGTTLLLVRAAFDRRDSRRSAAERVQRVRGFAVGVFGIQRMMGAALTAESWHGFQLAIAEDRGEQPVIYSDAPGPDPLDPHEAAQAGLVYETVRTFGSRRWRLKFRATGEYVRNEYTWQPYGVLAEGLALCGFVTAFLLVLTGRTSRIEHLVEARTEELSRTAEELGREIAVRHQVEADLRLARDEALEASRVKSDFLANMSHEIRTPVNAIIGFSDLLARSSLDEESKHLSALIRTAGGDLLQVINAVLDYSKIESGELEPVRNPFDLQVSLETIVELMSLRAAEKGLEIVIDDPEPLSEDVVSDEGMIRQILLNLVSNALKFTERGRVTLRVRHIPEGPGVRRFRIEVIDTGIGVPEQVQAHLFQKFFQANPSMAAGQTGTGLGLAICKQLVGLLGGEIGFTSRPGFGSTFYFELPMEVRPRSTDEARRPGSPTVVGASTGDEGALLLLVVDDNLANQLVLVKIAERMGHESHVAADGRQALEMLEHHTYDVVLMDCNMPVMDGYATTRAIRARRPSGPGATPAEVRVVGVTAYALPGDREKCLAAGMDDYLSKPVTVASLAAALGQAPPPAGGESRAPATVRDFDADEELRDVRFQVRQLVESTGPGAGLTIIRGFLNDLEPRLGRIEQALLHEENEKLTLETHSLAGACATAGARRIVRTLLALEDRARNGELARFRAEIGPLRKELERLRELLKQVISELE